jgi:hypothetical protein
MKWAETQFIIKVYTDIEKWNCVCVCVCGVVCVCVLCCVVCVYSNIFTVL